MRRLDNVPYHEHNAITLLMKLRHQCAILHRKCGLATYIENVFRSEKSNVYTQRLREHGMVAFAEQNVPAKHHRIRGVAISAIRALTLTSKSWSMRLVLMSS